MTSEEIKRMEDQICKTTPHILFQQLARLQSDCEYYLCGGRRNPEKLWAKSPEDQILWMRTTYKRLKDIGKMPEWITEADIDNYLRRMSPKTIRIYIRGVPYLVEDILSPKDKGRLSEVFPDIQKAISLMDVKDEDTMFEMFLNKVYTRLGITLTPVSVSAVYRIR